jgi:3-hydroxyisobutyrate dehydrogenase
MTTKQNSKPRIGFIGMGHMAPRLLDAGYPLTVYDRTREKAQAIGQRGALVAQTPKDLAASCEVIISCVTENPRHSAGFLTPAVRRVSRQVLTLALDNIHLCDI